MLDAAPPLENGRYRLIRRIGQGGMASVYQAWDRRLEVWRAIKLLDPRFGSSSARARFEQEARTMARLRHRNLLTVYDVGDDAGRLYLVMDLVLGGSLADRLERDGPFSPRLASRLVRDVLSGLQCAHEGGVVHRDVKPQNVLLDADGTPLVSDFGIARVTTADLTGTGAMVGTLAYMAPEQRSNAKDADARADVYAAACTLYALVVGREPHDPYMDAPACWDAVPEPLVPVLRRATRWAREERWPSAAAFRDALAEVETLLPTSPRDALSLTVSADTLDPPPATGAVEAPSADTYADPDLPASFGVAPATTAAPAEIPRRRAVPLAPIAGVGLAIAVAIAAIAWTSGDEPEARVPTAPTVSILSTNDPAENPVRDLAVSPDGRVLYAAAHGLWRIGLDGSGDEPVALPEPLASRQVASLSFAADGALLVVTGEEAWRVEGDVVEPVPLAPDTWNLRPLSGGRATVITPSGLWVGRPDALERLLIAKGPQDALGLWRVSPDEQRLAALMTRQTAHRIEIAAMDGSSQRTLLASPRLQNRVGTAAFAWLDDEWLAYVRAGADEGDAAVVVARHVDSGEERELHRFADGEIDDLHRVPGADTLVFTALRSESRVWVAALGDEGRRLDGARRLTLDRVDSYQPAWLDASTLAFARRSAGVFELFVQGVDEPAPRKLARQPDGHLASPTRLPGGLGALATAGDERWWVHVGAADGPHERWVPASEAAIVGCALAAPVCYCARPGPVTTTLLRGDAAGCGEVLREHPEEVNALAASPDGRRVAAVGVAQVWLVDATTGEARALEADLTAHHVAWAPDGRYLIVTGWQPDGSSVLARLTPDGSEPPIVLRAPVGWIGAPEVSPDGAHVAWAEMNLASQVWRLDGAGLP